MAACCRYVSLRNVQYVKPVAYVQYLQYVWCKHLYVSHMYFVLSVIPGPMSWVQRQMQEGKDPRQILTQLLPSGAELPDGLHEVMLWKIIVSILSEPPARKKLVTQNTLEDFLHLMSNCRNIMVLTGAGVSELSAISIM